MTDNTLSRAMKASASPARECASDCPVIPLPQALELIRLHAKRRVYFEHGRLVLDYSARRRDRSASVRVTSKRQAVNQ